MFRSKPVGLLLKILCLILVVYMALTFLHVRRQISDTKNTIETLTQQVNDQTQTNTELSTAIVFGVLIIVLLVKPAGLLGKTVREKV